MQTNQKQIFTLKDLNGQDVEAIMSGLGELLGKHSRVTANKVESQIIQQLQAQELQKQSMAKSEVLATVQGIVE